MGVSICTYGIGAPEIRDLVVWAEEAGFESVWVGEHLVVPSRHRSEHPMQPGTTAQHSGRDMLDPSVVLADPLVALAAGAGATSTVGLATAIYLLPLRHPLVTARAAATLHDVSGGRLTLGVGSGWLEEEFDALGIPFAERGRRYEESLEVLRLAWAGGSFSFDGSCFRFPELQVTPHPVDVPLVLGGNTDRAMARAARLGDGWITSGTPTFEDAVDLHGRILGHVDRVRVERTGSRAFRAHVRMPGTDPADLARYRAAGIDDVVVWAHAIHDGVDPADREARRRAVLDTGRTLGLVAPAT